MRKDGLSAPQRLGLLLPWLNDPGPPLTSSPPEVTRWVVRYQAAIARFLVSFDDSTAAGHIELIRRGKGWSRALQPLAPAGRVDLDRDDLLILQDLVRQLLEVGLDRPDAIKRTVAMPSLAFGIRSQPRGDLKLSALSLRERRAYTSAGAYVLQVRGTARDLVLYLTLHLLTAPHMAGVLARCPAPAPNKWEEPCNRWFLRTGNGRRREYCSDACRVRRHYKNNSKQNSKKAGG
jgi:hypothetical protein